MTVCVKTTYSVKVFNTGTLAAGQVEVVAELPPQLKFVRATGPAQFKVEGQKVVFGAVDSLKANGTAAYTVEVEAVSPGDARFKVEARSPVLSAPLREEESTRVVPKGGP